MAIAKPVRALGIAVFFVSFYFLYTVFWTPKEPNIAGSEDFHGTIPRDPNLDRKRTHLAHYAAPRYTELHLLLLDDPRY